MNIFQFIKFRLKPELKKIWFNISNNQKISYSQCGEDLIVRQLLDQLGIGEVTYLDIGAHHPSYLSNTYLFYVKGSRGVCVEPAPALFKEFKIKRPQDTSLNCGIGIAHGFAEFYLMSTSSLNTFSKVEAERYQANGNQSILGILNIELRTINEIIEENFKKCPHFVSMDVEGLDFVILQNFDFSKFRPQVFCLETLTYTDDKSERKLMEISDFMHGQDYMTYADTYINTIFVDKFAWEKRL